MIERDQDYIVVFTSCPKGTQRHWWNLFTRSGFEHIVIFTYLERNAVWVYFDWSTSGFKTWVLSPREMSDVVGSLGERNATFVRMARREGVVKFGFAPAYCVTIVRHIIGIPGWAFMTPYYLYRKMIKLGAEVIDYHPVWGRGV